MARYLGTKAVAYISASGSTAAVNVPNLTKFGVGNARSMNDVTACNDANMRYLPGLPDYKGSLDVFFDDTNTAALFTSAASTDGVLMYLYPSAAAPTRYFYGPAWVSITSFDSGGINGPAKVSLDWAANGTWAEKLS